MNQVYNLRQLNYLNCQDMENKHRIEPQQLIDENRTFSRPAIQNVHNQLPTVQKQYYAVAIIGVQNSGKSTLLNNLFGTNFQVLHKIAGSRTTRGILVSMDKEQNILIMDVEGNDAQDRANEQEYEKMISTFALVEADTLIINVWSRTLGQYTGSQYQTLTAVLQICISQFKQQSPKTLLFCVRDYNSEQEQEGQIRRKIAKDVNNIWLKIQKPAQYAKYDSTPQKFFNIQVAVLRAYKQKNPKYFLQDVKKLRQRFINPKDEGYVFKHKKTSFNLPLKDLPQLMQNSWASIITNKKLNLPNEKQQLSNFRCSDILNETIIKFKEEIHKLLQKKAIIDFGKIFDHYTKSFQVQTYNYGRLIVEDKQKTLKQQMTDTIKKNINQILDSQQIKLKEQFRNNSIYINQQNSRTLQGKLLELRNQTIQAYAHIFKNLNFQNESRKLRIQKITDFLDKSSTETIKKIKEVVSAQFQKQSSRQIRLLSSQMLKNHFGKDFWTNVQKKYIAKSKLLMKDYQIKVLWSQNRLLQPNEIDALDQTMSAQLKKTIRQQFQKSLMNRVFQLFLNQFIKNKEGVSYNFNILQQSKIAELYDQARDNARQLVALINLYNIRKSKKSTILQFEQQQKDEFFESTWLSNALTSLDRQMINEHETIIRRKKEEQMKRVPIWLFVFIIYFVYDDLWFSSQTYPITNFLLTLFLIFVTFFFAIGQHNAFMELWNLALDSGKQAINKIRNRTTQ